MRIAGMYVINEACIFVFLIFIFVRTREGYFLDTFVWFEKESGRKESEWKEREYKMR